MELRDYIHLPFFKATTIKSEKEICWNIFGIVVDGKGNLFDPVDFNDIDIQTIVTRTNLKVWQDIELYF